MLSSESKHSDTAKEEKSKTNKSKKKDKESKRKKKHSSNRITLTREKESSTPMPKIKPLKLAKTPSIVLELLAVPHPDKAVSAQIS